MCWSWPPWTVRHIAQIQKRIATGESLDQIAGAIGGDWQAEARKYHRKRYDFKRACVNLERFKAIDQFAEWVADKIYAFLRDIGVERPGRIDDKISRAVSKPQFINDTLELLRRGFTPVMVVTEEEVTVAADFVLGSAFGNSEVGIQPLLVVPIRAAFIEAFAISEPDLPKEPSLIPTMQVAECCEKTTRVRRYRHKDKWGFTLEVKSSAPSSGGNPRGPRRQHSRRRSFRL
jgi:hypothetical protein